MPPDPPAPVLPAVPPSQAGPGGGGLPSGVATVTINPENIVRVNTSVEPANIQPGEALSGRVLVTGTLYGRDTGGECTPAQQYDQTTALPPGWSYPFRILPGEGGVHIPVTGTQHQTSNFLCGGPRLVSTDEITFQISGADTANLAPGCYQLTWVNQHLSTPENTQGTIAAFSVGGVPCGARTLDLAAATSYAGNFSPGFTGNLVGSALARATGTGAADVAKICVRTDWTATAELSKLQATSTPMYWNEQVFPFQDLPNTYFKGVTRQVTLAPPDGTGTDKFLPGSTYSETVRIESCATGTEALLSVPLTLKVIGEFENIQHRVAVLAYDGNDKLLGSVVSEDSGTQSLDSFNLKAATAQRFVLP